MATRITLTLILTPKLNLTITLILTSTLTLTLTLTLILTFTQTQTLWIRGYMATRTVIGTLSNDEDDCSENVAKKINLCSFELNRVYLDPLNMSNAGDFSWSGILKDFIQAQKEEGKFVVVCPRPP